MDIHNVIDGEIYYVDSSDTPARLVVYTNQLINSEVNATRELKKSKIPVARLSLRRVKRWHQFLDPRLNGHSL